MQGLVVDVAIINANKNLQKRNVILCIIKKLIKGDKQITKLCLILNELLSFYQK